MKYALLIPAAGRGERLGAPVSKALVAIHGKPLIWWALNAFADDARLIEVVIAAPEDSSGQFQSALQSHPLIGRTKFCRGGETRQESVGEALAKTNSEIDCVLVHDAARPLVTRKVIDNVLDALASNTAAVPGIAVTDTVKRVNSASKVIETLRREELFSVQTPQGVRMREFRTAHELARKHGVQCTDDVALIEHFTLGTVVLVPGDPQNLKITHPHELPRAEDLLRGGVHP